MSKLSFKNDTVQSSVVVLKDGSCLEVRNGNKTKWLPNEVRNKWPSVEAWRATLPADATLKEEKRPTIIRKGYHDLKDPILLKILSAVIARVSGKTFVRRPYVIGQLGNDRNGSRQVQHEIHAMRRVARGLEYGGLNPTSAVSLDAVNARLAALDKKYNEIIAGSPHPGWYIRGRAARTLDSGFYLDDGNGKMYPIFWNSDAEVVMVWIPTCGLVPIRDLGMSTDKILQSIWHAPIHKMGGPAIYRL